ncbi:MAG: protease HtpX [Alphaproteobacteria bacterium]|nr:protease HtpX [Alphaproteobacteria bacterium]
MKRFFLFILINFVILLTIGFIVSFLGLDAYYASNDLSSLLALCAIWGFTGSIISLLLSKTMAKLSVNAKTILPDTTNSEEAWLLNTVSDLAENAQLTMPEVAIYNGAANAFATGAFKNSALIAVSTGLLKSMPKNEIKAVLGHEMSHIKNGDMVTMTLLQGTLNTFVYFLARIITIFLQNRNNEDTNRRYNTSSYMTIRLLEFILGFLAMLISCGYSRRREYKADAGSAELTSSPQDMIAALTTLKNIENGNLPKSLQTFGITNGENFTELFMTHPLLDKRISALEKEFDVISYKKKSGGIFGSLK